MPSGTSYTAVQPDDFLACRKVLGLEVSEHALATFCHMMSWDFVPRVARQEETPGWVSGQTPDWGCRR